jgi:MYXO-CTERM domain-containing protein
MTMGKTGIVAGVVLALAAALFVIRRRRDRARLETSTVILWE